MVSFDQQYIPDALIRSKSRIPVLPPGAPFLLRSMTDEDIDFKELASVIEKFPSIAARLIGLANSAWSSPRTAITSLNDACVRMGFDVVRSVSLGLAVSTPFNQKRCKGFNTEHFWCSSLLTADAAALMVEHGSFQEEIDQPSARAAGLLHNLGLLWLADRMPNETSKALLACQQDPEVSTNDALIEHCGINYCQAGGFLGEMWNLPETLIVTMAYHSDHDYHDSFWKSARLIGASESIVSSLYHHKQWHSNDDLPIASEIQKTVLDSTALRLNYTRGLAQALFPSE